MTVLQPRTLDATIQLQGTSFNNPIPDGVLSAINAPAAGSDPSLMYVGPQNVTLKGDGTWIVGVWATFQGTASYHLRLQIQLNGGTVADTGDIANTLAAQNVPYERALFYRAVLPHGTVLRICGGYSGTPIPTGRLIIAKESIG